MNEHLRKAWSFVRKNGVGIGLELAVNFLAPYLVYTWTKAQLGDVRALIASSLPPIAWSLFEFARRRRVDALSLFVLLGIGLSLIAFFGGGSARFLQLRETLVKGVIGLIFLGSAAIGRPLIYELARANLKRRSEAHAASLDAVREKPFFRRAMTVMTLVWGGAMVAETAVAAVLIFHLSIADYLIVGPIFGYGSTGLLVLWTFWYSRQIGRNAVAAAPVEAGTPAA